MTVLGSPSSGAGPVESLRGGFSLTTLVIRLAVAAAVLFLIAAALIAYGPAAIAAAIGVQPAVRSETAVRALALGVTLAAFGGFLFVFKGSAHAPSDSGAPPTDAAIDTRPPEERISQVVASPALAARAAAIDVEAISPREALVLSRVFQNVGSQTLEMLAEHTARQDFRAGQVLFTEGDPGEEAFVIAQGEVEVLTTRHGQQVVLSRLGVGSLVGEMAVLLSARPRSATVRAVSPVVAFAVRAAALRAATRTDSALAATVSARMSQLGADAFLKLASPFVNLPSAAIFELAGRMKARTLQSGDSLMQQGESGDTFFLVRSGRLLVSREGDGAEGRRHSRQLVQLGPGDCAGEAALLTDQPRSATVVALEPTEVLELSRADFDQIVERHQTARAFFRELSLARYHSAPKRLLAAADPVSTLLPRLQREEAGRVILAFGAGVVVLAILSYVTILTGQRAFAWITIVFGAMLPAVAYVAYVQERHLLGDIPVLTLLGVSVAAGAIGVPLAIYLQEYAAPKVFNVIPATLRTDQVLPAAFMTALIEEPLKLAAVFWVMRRHQYRFALDGVIFGITAAMGFGGLESLGYGLLGLSNPYQLCGSFDGTYCMIQTLWIRLFTAFLGHGPWTAIVCATLFRERGRMASVFNRRVILAFLLVVVLHTLWDANPILLGIPVAAVSLLTLRGLLREGQAQQAAALSSLTLVRADARVDERDKIVCRRCSLHFPASAIYCVRCGLSLA